MQDNRKRRTALGTVCLVVVALVMGWFVGQYVPGTPQSPETLVYATMYSGNGTPVQNTVDTSFGEQATLEGVVQGESFTLDETRSDLQTEQGRQAYRDHLEDIGAWEHEYPPFAMRIEEVRTVSADSFADLYPNFSSKQQHTRGFFIHPGGNLNLQDTTMILVSVSITNKSEELISGYPHPFGKGALPSCNLFRTDWCEMQGESVAFGDQVIIEAGPLSDGTLGSGEILEDSAFVAINDDPVYLDNPDPNGIQYAYIHIEPGETKTYVFPYLVPDKVLGGDGRHPDLSNLCIQTPDYATETVYRLWLE